MGIDDGHMRREIDMKDRKNHPKIESMICRQSLRLKGMGINFLHSLYFFRSG